MPHFLSVDYVNQFNPVRISAFQSLLGVVAVCCPLIFLSCLAYPKEDSIQLPVFHGSCLRIHVNADISSSTAVLTIIKISLTLLLPIVV